jgi:hypothetical protein
MYSPDRVPANYQINNQILEHPFTDYWDVFVLKHQHPINVGLHLLGILLFYGVLAAAWMFRNPWVLLGLPLTQFTGLLGHLLFERSHIDRQDAVFSWRASYCLGRMLLRVLLGKYAGDVRQRRAVLQQYQSTRRRVNPHADF